MYLRICWSAQWAPLHLFSQSFAKLEFGGESPLTIRAWCSALRYCPDPLGIVTAKQLYKLEFGGESPLTMRARCSALRYCPDPLGIVTAKQLYKLESACLNHLFFRNYNRLVEACFFGELPYYFMASTCHKQVCHFLSAGGSVFTFEFAHLQRILIVNDILD